MSMNLKQLQQKHDLSDLEVFKQDTTNHKISFIANNLKSSEETHQSGCAVRLIHKNKIGFASSYGMTNTEEIILKAKEVSKFFPEVKIKFPSDLNISETSNVDKNEEALSTLKEEGIQIISTLLDSVSSKSLLVDISFEISNIFESVENSNNLHYSHSKNIFSSLISLRETIENNFIEIYAAITDKVKPDFKASTKELAESYKLSRKHTKITNGSCPVLFTSKAAKDLLAIIKLALSGKQVAEKSSPWHDKLGKQVLSKSITLKQDPLFGFMARSVDDEGLLVKPMILVEGGILKNFYYDLLSASRGDWPVAPTGNGFKPSLTTQVEPSLLNIVVTQGSESLEKIIKSIDYGLLLDQTIGGLTANISGDISMNVDLGFLIDKGELVGRVKDTMVSGNIYTALNNVQKLSNNCSWDGANIYNPDMLLGGFTITS